MLGLASLNPAGALSVVPDSSLPTSLLETRSLVTDLTPYLGVSLVFSRVKTSPCPLPKSRAGG